MALLRPFRPVRGGAHRIQANVPRGKRPRPDYSLVRQRCLGDEAGVRLDAENVEAADDAEALLKAEHLLIPSQYLSIEVWQEKRLVGRLSLLPSFGMGQAKGDRPQPE